MSQYKIGDYDLKQIQDIMLQIMTEIDRICRKNNIRYILSGGTLLGAACEKWVRDPLHLLRRHAAAVVGDRDGQLVGREIRVHRDLDQSRLRLGGILRHVQDIQGNFGHHRRLPVLFILGQDTRDIVGNQTSVNLVIDHHDGGKAARAYAAAGIQREFPVRGALSAGDA